MGHRREKRMRRQKRKAGANPFDAKYEPTPNPLDRLPTTLDSAVLCNELVQDDLPYGNLRTLTTSSQSGSSLENLSRQSTLEPLSPKTSSTSSELTLEVTSDGADARPSIPEAIPEHGILQSQTTSSDDNDARSMTLVTSRSHSAFSKANEDTTIYHIYHSGKRAENFVIHTIKDEDIPLCQVDDPTLPNYVEHEKYKNFKTCKAAKFLRSLFCLGPQKFTHPRYIKRDLSVDDPILDCRYGKSPYYMHNPHLAWHLPARTIRRDGLKDGPVVCLVRPTRFGWRHWDISFDKRLTDDEILDGRGVVPKEYGRRNGQGMYKGYRFRNFRWWRESGAAWHKEEKERRQILRDDIEKGIAAAPPRYKEPFVPAETIKLHWSSPFSVNTRKYHFRFCDIDFYWKGTGTVCDKKKLGILCGFNHLKLVASVPLETSPRESKPGLSRKKGQYRRDICLAKYTSLISLRKAGRLEVFDKIVEDLFDEHLAPSLEKDLLERKRQQLTDLIVTTALCMIIQEDQKREVLQEIFELALDAAENAG